MRRDVIEQKLAAALEPHSLDVIDESEQHRGHAGHRDGGETHFRIYVTAQAFAGKSRLERHRMVNAILADDLTSGVHALAIHADAPDDVAASPKAPG